MNRRSKAGFTLLELLAVLGVLFLIVSVILPKSSPRKVRPSRVVCVNNLKNVGLAFRIFATDNQDQYPGEILSKRWEDPRLIRSESIFLAISNELSSPGLLHCPADKQRAPARSFQDFLSDDLSYFASISARETEPEMMQAGDRNIEIDGTLVTGLLPLTTNLAPSWSRDLHDRQGNIAMADGSVQQFSTSRLRDTLNRSLGARTNWLVFP